MLALALGASPASGAPEWQIRPFAGVTLGGGTNVIEDLEFASGSANLAIGLSAGLLGDILGVEVDLGHMPGFFQKGDARLVSSSRVTTLTGNVIVGLPRRATQYSLRPYFVGGFGLVRGRTESLSGLNLDLTRPAMNAGGGVSGALSDRTALSWELRYFRSLGGEFDVVGLDPEKLSFWRANMALVVRLGGLSP